LLSEVGGRLEVDDLLSGLLELLLEAFVVGMLEDVMTFHKVTISSVEDLRVRARAFTS